MGSHLCSGELQTRWWEPLNPHPRPQLLPKKPSGPAAEEDIGGTEGPSTLLGAEPQDDSCSPALGAVPGNGGLGSREPTLAMSPREKTHRGLDVLARLASPAVNQGCLKIIQDWDLWSWRPELGPLMRGGSMGPWVQEHRTSGGLWGLRRSPAPGSVE